MSTMLERADAILSLAFVLIGAAIWMRVVPTLAPSKPLRRSPSQPHELSETLRITFVYGHADPIVRTARVLLAGVAILAAVVLGIRLLTA